MTAAGIGDSLERLAHAYQRSSIVNLAILAFEDVLAIHSPEDNFAELVVKRVCEAYVANHSILEICPWSHLCLFVRVCNYYCSTFKRDAGQELPRQTGQFILSQFVRDRLAPRKALKQQTIHKMFASVQARLFVQL
jgi:hypothetical protein